MLKNYYKIIIRNLFKNKIYTLISILGLALGICCSILIGLYVYNELSYDKYHLDHERIYRLESHFHIQESNDLFAATSFPLAPALKVEFAGVEEFVRFQPMDNNLFIYDGRNYFNENMYFADSTVFSVFTHKILAGSAESALTEPNTMVLTESFAARIFGDEDPLDKVIRAGNGLTFRITGVIADLPQNSHLQFDGLASMITLAQFFGPERFHSLDPNLFWNIGLYSYIKLAEKADISEVTENFQSVVYDKYMKSIGDMLNASFDLMVQPLAQVHLHSKVGYDQPSGNISYIYIFFIVAVFLLIIGCINYMNLATARSAKRALEVGMRKVVGATKVSLRSQFLLESMIITLLALVIAIIGANLLLPVFNQLSGKELTLSLFNDLRYIGLGVVIILLTGLLAGSYPAFYLSSFQPVDVLKENLLSGRKGGLLRKLLVIFQFTISVIMIIGTLTVFNQLNYIKQMDKGFDDDSIVVLTIRDTTGVRNLEAFQQELLKHQNILKSGTASSIPGGGYGIIVQRIEALDGSFLEKGVNFVFVDHHYLDVMDMKIIEGRAFDPNLQTDLEESVIINEAAVRNFGWGDDILGKEIQFGAGIEGDAARYTKVVGVVKDFHYASLHNAVEPLLILLSDSPLRNINLKISNHNIPATLKYIEEKWKEFNPTFPFEYSFLDDNLNQQYIAEQKISQVFSYFTIICILIASMGLFGLASFTAEQRTREIGIRKVLGADTASIIRILSREFLICVIWANIIAWPVAYYFLDKWLSNFVYRVNVSLLIMLVSGLIALLISLLTVISQAIKAASVNPVISLKYE